MGLKVYDLGFVLCGSLSFVCMALANNEGGPPVVSACYKQIERDCSDVAGVDEGRTCTHGTTSQSCGDLVVEDATAFDIEIAGPNQSGKVNTDETCGSVQIKARLYRCGVVDPDPKKSEQLCVDLNERTLTCKHRCPSGAACTGQEISFP